MSRIRFKGRAHDRTSPLLRIPWVLIFGIGLAIVRPSVAQNDAKGTIYSYYGLGERMDFSSSRSQAMGGSGLALRSANATNYGNPATLSDMFIVRFTAGALFQTFSESATGAATNKHSSGTLNALQLSLPIIPGKMGFSISSTPYTRVNYRVVDSGFFESEPGVGDFRPFDVSFYGNGGLQRFSPAIGFSPGRNFSVGASADIIFGILEDIQETSFENLAFEDGQITNATRLSGLTSTIGVWYRRTRFLSNGDGIYLGATLTLPSHLSGERVVTTGSGEAIDTLSAMSVHSVGLPLSGTASLAYQKNERMTVAFDVLYEGWSNTTSDVPFAGFNPNGSSNYSDRLRLSGGVEYGGALANDSFIARAYVRFGVYYDRSYVAMQDGTKIESMGLTSGVSLPTFFSGTTLDINIDVGQTGTTDRGLVRDRYYKFGINLNFGERWFNRIKLQ